MSTPQDRIPKPIQPDATSVNTPRTPTADIGWRDFLRQMLPEPIRDIIPTTEEAKTIEAKREIDRRLPYSRDLPSSSPEREAEIDRLFEIRQSGGGILAPREPELLERLGVPAEIRNFLSEAPLNRAIKGVGDITGVSSGNPMELIEGPAAGVGGFGGRLFNRIDRAADVFKQDKGTGAQWLKQLTTNVPKQESDAIRGILESNADRVYTKDEIKELISTNYDAPIISEVRFGLTKHNGVKHELTQETPTRWKFGRDEIIKEADNKYVMYNELGGQYQGPNGTRLEFKTLEDAASFRQSMANWEEDTSKWSQYLIPGGRDYEEIVLTTPKGGIFESTVHWPDVENPVTHLRMTTREGIDPTIIPKKREFGKLDESGSLSYGDDVFIEDYGNGKFAVIHKGKYTYDAKSLEEAKQFVETNIGPNLPIDKLKVRQIDELQSDWAQKIRKAQMKGIGLRPKGGLPEMPEVKLPKEVEVYNDMHRQEFEYEGQKWRLDYDETGGIKLPYKISFDRPIGGVSNARRVSSPEQAKEYVKMYTYLTKTSDMDFKQTDQWVDLGLGRAIQSAIDEGADVLTWLPGELQYKMYGTNLVKWQPPKNASGQKIRTTIKEVLDIDDDIKKTYDWGSNISISEARKISNMSREELEELANSELLDEAEIAKRLLQKFDNQDVDSAPAFRVSAKKQHSGEIPGIGSLEELAMQQDPSAYGEYDAIIRTKEELEKILRGVLEDPDEAPARANKLWEQMLENPSGQVAPRKEGNDYFYDKLIPKRIKEVGKKLGIKLEPEEITVNYQGKPTKQLGIRITDELKEIMKKGFPALGIAGIGATGALKQQEEKDPMDELFD